MNPFKSLAIFIRNLFTPKPPKIEPIIPVNKPKPEPEELPHEEIKPEVTSLDLVKFTENIEKTFKLTLSPRQLDSIILIVRECEKQGLEVTKNPEDDDKMAYVFATAYHETNVKKVGGPLVPITEQGSFLYLRSKRYYPYIGRGFVQLTWLDNYKKYSKIMGKDLVADPDIVLDPAISAFILVHGMINGTFTGKSLSHYFNSNWSDPLNARRIINGTDKKELIAGYFDKFKKCLYESKKREISETKSDILA